MAGIKKLVLYGAGGMGREVATIIDLINAVAPAYELAGFVDDGCEVGCQVGRYQVLGDATWLVARRKEYVCVCTIGDAAIKANVMESLIGQGVSFETIVAPDVVIPSSTIVGPGCVFYSGAIVSVDCSIGKGVLVNAYSTIGHDAVIGDYCSIMPGVGISGNCQIGNRVDIGGHSFFVPGRKVGDDARIAAGSVVFSHVKAGTTVLGNPAKRMKAIE